MTTHKQIVSINIPFAGFYETKWSHLIDDAENMDVENWQERQAEENIPQSLRITNDDYAEILMRHTKWRDAHRTIAKAYVEAFDSEVSEPVGIKLGLAYEEMTSPREYNFETDRIFCDMRLGVAYLMFRKSREENHLTLANMIRSRFTSRDGFISHYSNRLHDWLEKPLRDWDHNELGTLLLALMPEENNDGEEIDWSIYYSLADGSCVGYDAWSNAVDWEAVDSDIKERRAEILAELQEENPDYVPPYRCTETPDMFDNKN